MFIAETEVGSDYLGHMRWVAADLDFAVEPVAGNLEVGPGAAIYRLRDAVMLAENIEPQLEAWLDGLGVRRLPARHTTLAFSRSGSAIIGHGEDHIESETAVLADDAAILDHLSEPELRGTLRVVPHTSVVTDPTNRRLASPLIFFVDRGLILHQRRARGPIAAVSAGQAHEALPRIASSLAGHGRLRRTGQAGFKCVATPDGASLVARLGKGKALVIAGLGPSAAFLAPVLTRLLADAASADEASYFSRRGASAVGGRRRVAETPAIELTA
jgi:hypothetical protein